MESKFKEKTNKNYNRILSLEMEVKNLTEKLIDKCKESKKSQESI